MTRRSTGIAYTEIVTEVHITTVSTAWTIQEGASLKDMLDDVAADVQHVVLVF